MISRGDGIVYVDFETKEIERPDDLKIPNKSDYNRAVSSKT